MDEDQNSVPSDGQSGHSVGIHNHGRREKYGIDGSELSWGAGEEEPS